MLRCRAVLCCAVMCCDVLCCVVLCTEELYDHTGDDSFEMDKYENVNEASSSPANKAVASKLRAQVQAFFSRDGQERSAAVMGAADESQLPDNSDPYDLLE